MKWVQEYLNEVEKENYAPQKYYVDEYHRTIVNFSN